MSLLGLQQDAVNLMAAALAGLPGSGVVEGTLTPVAAAARSVSVIRFLDEAPKGNVQQRSATLGFWLSEVPELLTDGATCVVDGVTWTIRTSTLQAALQIAKAWA